MKRRFPHLGPNNTILGGLVTFTILYTAVGREYKSFDIYESLSFGQFKWRQDATCLLS